MDEPSSQPESKQPPAPVEPAVQPAILMPPGIIPPFGFPQGVPAGMMIGIAQQSSWQGPYPPPEAAERFEALHPGFLDRVLKMAEREQSARIDNNIVTQNFTQKDVARGHWLGAGISLAAIVGAVICAAVGSPWVGATCVGVPVLAVALALVQTYRQNSSTVATMPVVPIAAPPPGPAEAQIATPALKSEEKPSSG